MNTFCSSMFWQLEAKNASWSELVLKMKWLTEVWLNTYHTGNDFTEQKLCMHSNISEILRVISRISEPITGMFILTSMYFSWWFQIWSWNSTIFTQIVKFLSHGLHSSPAAWKALKLILKIVSFNLIFSWIQLQCKQTLRSMNPHEGASQGNTSIG